MDAMRYNWLFVLPLVAVIAISIATILRFRKKKLRKPKHDNSSLIAHTKTIRELPEYKAAKKHYIMHLNNNWLHNAPNLQNHIPSQIYTK